MGRKQFRTLMAGCSAMLGVLVATGAQAFVGVITVGLGEMDPSIGRIQASFSADATLETEEMTANTRIYYSPGKVRDELNMGGQQMVTINRMDLEKVWVILGAGMYMEVDPGEGSEQAPNYTLVSREEIGRETVNGMETTKYKSVYESKDGKFGGFTWYTDDNIAVKGFLISETKGEKQRVKYELTNLERGSQDDSLFEVPEGYQQLNMGTLVNTPSLEQMRRDAEKSFSGPVPGSAAAKQAAPVAVEEEEESFIMEVAREAQDEAVNSTNEHKEETKQDIRDSVRKGIGKLFGR